MGYSQQIDSFVKAYARNVTIVGVETMGGYYVHSEHIPVVYKLPNSEIKSKFSIVYVVHDALEKPDQPKGRGLYQIMKFGLNRMTFWNKDTHKWSLY